MHPLPSTYSFGRICDCPFSSCHSQSNRPRSFWIPVSRVLFQYTSLNVHWIWKPKRRPFEYHFRNPTPTLKSFSALNLGMFKINSIRNLKSALHFSLLFRVPYLGNKHPYHQVSAVLCHGYLEDMYVRGDCVLWTLWGTAEMCLPALVFD